MYRFAQSDVETYWRDHAQRIAPLDFERDPDALENVCHPAHGFEVNAFYAKYQASVYRRLLAQVPNGQGTAKALEVGCGAGRWCRLLAAHGYDVTGVDLQESLIATNRETYPSMNFVCASFDDFEAGPEQFSLVSSVTVLQHNTFDAQKRLIRKARSLLHSGGYAITLENVMDQTEHVFANTAAAWEKIFEEAGFVLRAKVPYDYSACLRACNFASHSANRLIQRVKQGKPRPSSQLTMTDGIYAINATRALWPTPLQQAKDACMNVAARMDDKIEPFVGHVLPWLRPIHCGFLFQAVD